MSISISVPEEDIYSLLFHVDLSIDLLQLILVMYLGIVVIQWRERIGILCFIENFHVYPTYIKKNVIEVSYKVPKDKF